MLTSSFSDIQPYKLADFDQFIAYLNTQLSDNGAGDHPYFMPLDRIDSNVSPALAESFRYSFAILYSIPGWRHLWVIRSPDSNIIGHIDLRAHFDQQAAHRCMLGIGVARRYRKMGIGTMLIAHAEKWARENTSLQWIDLYELSVNIPAIKLYEATGFCKVGEIPAKYKMDGMYFSEMIMAKELV